MFKFSIISQFPMEPPRSSESTSSSRVPHGSESIGATLCLFPELHPPQVGPLSLYFPYLSSLHPAGEPHPPSLLPYPFYSSHTGLLTVPQTCKLISTSGLPLPFPTPVIPSPWIFTRLAPSQYLRLCSEASRVGLDRHSPTPHVPPTRQWFPEARAQV